MTEQHSIWKQETEDSLGISHGSDRVFKRILSLLADLEVALNTISQFRTDSDIQDAVVTELRGKLEACEHLHLTIFDETVKTHKVYLDLKAQLEAKDKELQVLKAAVVKSATYYIPDHVTGDVERCHFCSAIWREDDEEKMTHESSCLALTCQAPI